VRFINFVYIFFRSKITISEFHNHLSWVATSFFCMCISFFAPFQTAFLAISKQYNLIKNPTQCSTVCPRYLRVCYSRFWLLADANKWPKFDIGGFSLDYLRILSSIALKKHGKNVLLLAALFLAGYFENVTTAKL